MTSGTKPGQLDADREPSAPAAVASRPWRLRVALTLCGVVGIAAVTAMLTLGVAGDLAVQPLPGLRAPDQLVPWLLPTVRLVARLAQALTVGSLLAAVAFVPTDGRLLAAHGWWLTGWARRSAAVWAVCQAALLPLTTADILGIPPAQLTARSVFSTMTVTEFGRQLVTVAGLAALTFVWARLSTTVAGVIIALAFASTAALFQASTGHASGSGGHQVAVSSMFLHLTGVTVWLGGLTAMTIVALRFSPRVADRAGHRFSALAAPAAMLVVASGLMNLAVRLGASPADWVSSAYGRIALLKAGLAAVLIGIGGAHRRLTLPRLAQGSPRAFQRLAVAELCVFAAVMGLASALSSTPPPDTGEPETIAGRLLGFPMPEPITFARVLTDWYPEPIFATGSAAAAVLYLVGVRRLASRGVRWPAIRTVLWLTACLVVLFATSSGVARYAPVLSYMHMIQHLLLAMVAAPMLVLAAPVTLALRALPSASDPRTTGPREWLLALVHCRFARILSNPLIAWAIFALAPFMVYLGSWYERSLRSHWVHLAVSAHFLFAAYLFFSVIIGVDPGFRRPAHIFRVLLLLTAGIAHAIFGIAVLQSNGSLAYEWFNQLARPWGPGLVADTRTAGGIAWSFGELPIAVILAVTVAQWAHDDEREQRRRDRAAELPGSAEAQAVQAYNDMLADLAAKDEPR